MTAFSFRMERPCGNRWRQVHEQGPAACGVFGGRGDGALGNRNLELGNLRWICGSGACGLGDVEIGKLGIGACGRRCLPLRGKGRAAPRICVRPFMALYRMLCSTRRRILPPFFFQPPAYRLPTNARLPREQKPAACLKAGKWFHLARDTGLTAPVILCTMALTEERRRLACETFIPRPARARRSARPTIKQNGRSCAPWPLPRRMWRAGASFPWRRRSARPGRC